LQYVFTLLLLHSEPSNSHICANWFYAEEPLSVSQCVATCYNVLQ